MRGHDRQQAAMYSYLSPEQRVPADHPLRPIRALVDEALRGLSSEFSRLYARTGRPSIAPEKLLRALLLQVLFSIRSERQLMEQLDYNLLYRWFVGLNMDDPVWDATTFTKNRDRLLAGDIAQGFFEQVLAQAHARDLVSTEHFSVDGTLLEAWAGHKSFQPKEPSAAPPSAGGRNPSVDFRGAPRTNDTHASTTDPDARLYKKAPGQEAKLAYLGHAVMEHRHGLAVQTCVTLATGTAERDAAVAMLATLPGTQRKTVGADKAYDTHGFVAALRDLGITPHVTQNTTNRASAIDGRTTGHAGYGFSLRARKRIEEIFGWLKTVAMLRKLRHRGLGRVWWIFTFAVAAYNLVRIRNLERQAATG